MALKNTKLTPLLNAGTGITLTSNGQIITVNSTGAGALPAGSDTQVQFNDGGILGADAGLTYNKTLNILGLEAIDFAITPTAGSAERRLLWDNDEGSLSLTLKGAATNIALGAEVAIMSYNAEATTLNKGEVVYLFGAQGQRPSVKRAVNTSDATSATTFGMAAESIASGATGFVMQMGIIRNINTNAYNEGDILYLGSTAGTVTTTKPYAPSHNVFVGVVLKKNASSGRIFVKPQNGYELDEIHNVSLSSITNNDFLVYESSSTLWKNKSISTVLGYIPEQPLTFSSPLSRSTNTISIPVATSLANGYLSSTDWSTFNGKQNALSGTGIVKSTSGTISYLTDNTSNWDTAYTNRITSLTITGSSGASTLVSNTLNVPNYTLAGLGGFANPMTTLGDIIYGGASGVATRLAGSTSASKVFLSQTGTGSASAIPAWSSVTKTDVGLANVENTALSTWAGSTNITTLGTIATGTWSATTIAVDKGGTGATTLTGVVIGSGTSAFTAVAGTASQLLRRNAGNTAYEFFTPTYLTSAITSLGALTASTQTFSNDTNVTITSATSTHTLGWTGQLSVGRGGTGASTLTGVLIGNGTSAVTAVAGTASQLLRRNAGNTAYEFFTFSGMTNPMTTLGDIIYEDATPAPARLAGNITTTKQYLSQTGTGTISAVPVWSAIAGTDVTGAALTKTDDTNVTLTLGGTPATSLLRAASLTLGWTGQLAVSRGGTGLSALGSALQVLRVNSGGTALEFATISSGGITSLNALTASTQTFANDTNVTITSATSTHTLGWSGQLAITRGGTGVSSVTTTPTASAFVGWDANVNLSADNFLSGYSTTATAGGTTTLVVGSNYYQYFTGTLTQTIVLPVVTTLVNGFAFRIVNLSTGNITINTSGGNAVQVMGSNTQLFVYVINTAGGTGTASWDWNYSIVKNANLPATIAGATTANALAKFNSSGGLIADSNITDNGTTITTSIALSATGGILNASFEASNAGVTNTTTWLGVSTNTTSAITLNRSTSTGTITANNNYIAVPVLSTTLTEAASGTHNFFANVAIKALSLTQGIASTSSAATLYIENQTNGTATITNNYALWVDDGITRLDGTAIINGADATTNSVKSAGYFQGSLTTGTPAVGIGTSIGFNTQTAASNYELGSVISSVSTNVTSTTEAFDLAFANMTGGATATERMRLKSTGQLQLNAYTSASAFTGTPLAALMANSSGNIISVEPVLQVTNLTISATAVQSAFTTPITLIAAQGAGKVILPVAFIFKLDSAGTAFATNTNYQFQIGTTAIGGSRSFAGTTDVFTMEPVSALVATAVANLQNQALVWKVLVGNPTGGTGATISIGCVYSVLTI